MFVWTAVQTIVICLIFLAFTMLCDPDVTWLNSLSSQSQRLVYSVFTLSSIQHVTNYLTLHVCVHLFLCLCVCATQSVRVHIDCGLTDRYFCQGECMGGCMWHVCACRSRNICVCSWRMLAHEFSQYVCTHMEMYAAMWHGQKYCVVSVWSISMRLCALCVRTMIMVQLCERNKV